MAEAKIYYQQDCNLSLLDGKTIAIMHMPSTLRSQDAMSSSVFTREASHGLRLRHRDLRYTQPLRLQSRLI